MPTLCDLRRAIARLDEDISSLGTQCGGNSLCKGLNTSEKRGTTLNTELELLVSESQLLGETGTGTVLGGSSSRVQDRSPRS